jgi:hypothetical protein
MRQYPKPIFPVKAIIWHTHEGAGIYYNVFSRTTVKETGQRRNMMDNDGICKQLESSLYTFRPELLTLGIQPRRPLVGHKVILEVVPVAGIR